MLRLLCLLSVSTCLLAPCVAEDWTVISGFESNRSIWRADGGGAGPVVSTDEAHSGNASLAVRLEHSDGARMVRATWATTIGDLAWSEASRLRFWLKGSPLARVPHGGVILVEAGGRVGGGDSHWMLNIDGAAYASRDFSLVDLGPLSTAINADWAPDADGRLDCEALSSLLFVAQQDTPGNTNVPYTVFMDDLEATDVTPRSANYFPATVEAAPDHVTPIWRGFVGRERAYHPTVTFSDITGWQAGARGAGEIRLARSEEEPCHDDLQYQAKVTYQSGGGDGWIELLPPEPIPITGEFNAACAWVYGNNWSWMPDPNTPVVNLWVRLLDASGQRHLLDLGAINFKFYGLLTKRLWETTQTDPGHLFWGGVSDGALHAPVVLEALEIRGGTNTEPRAIYIESVAFYQDDLALPEFEEDALDDLPFPTTPDTILPSLRQATRVEVRGEGKAFVFEITGDERMTYRYEPQTGTLSDLTVSVDGRPAFTPCASAGPALVLDGATREPGAEDLRVELLQANMSDGAVTTRWRATHGRESAEYGLALRAKGKSLVVDWSTDAPCSALRLGQAEGLSQPRLIRVPYLAIYQSGPAVLLEGDTFVLTLLDWYNTNSSALYSAAALADDGSAVMNGGSGYGPLTDGSLNPLRERQFINVSSRFDEVLPTVPNPPSDQREALKNNLYTHLGGISPERFDIWLDMWRQYHEHGIDHVFVTHHEDAWTNGADVGQGGQEYTMCIEAAPEVGDAKLIDYCQAMRGMGYYVGLYENFTDYNPLGASWDPRNAARSSQGEMMRVWPPTYALNPLKALDMARKYPRMVAEKFGCNTAYRDCHTAYPPWGQVDFRAGTPGAGMFSANFKAWGALLDDGSEAYGGPVFSEGLHQWFSAGLVDGSYGQINLPNAPEQPLLLDFDLRKLHPLGADISMCPGAAWGRGLYHGQAATIAYGHLGFLPVDNLATTGRYFYLQWALQQRYIMEEVEDILYHSQGQYLSVSEALRADRLTSQVLVRYRSGLQVAVNCNPTERWSVALGGQTYDLSPDAWAAVQGDSFEEYCTELDGVRVGYVRSPDYIFADAGGTVRDFPELRTDGAVVLRDERVITLAPPTVLELH